MKQGHFPEVIQLADLDGQNGFKLDGESQGDQSGLSVRAAGDVNGDKVADLILGAWGWNSHTGRSYVVFGGGGIGWNGLLSLADLDGGKGFKLDGENQEDKSGWSVSSAGDINGDGCADILIGAPFHNTHTGRSYVVWGDRAIDGAGVIALAGLDGDQGFKLDGEGANDNSGLSVSSAEDVNGDGYADWMIGAYYCTNGQGRTYVVFGGPEVGRSGLINLGRLNGADGFMLNGETYYNNSYSGWSVSGLGDVNGDAYPDLLIGAPCYISENGYCGAGRSYAVFGNKDISGGGSTVLLGNLNGANGFKIDGEVNGDYSGGSVSAAGDINGDGYGELLIGSALHNSNSGRSYVVWGGPSVGKGEIISLSGLTGSKGFKIDGEVSGDGSGYSVSVAGDINGDGYGDLLIGAPDYDNHRGRGYVVFGSQDVGSNGLISLSGLDGVNGFKLDGEVIGDENGYSISAVGDLNADGCDDLVIGAHGYDNGRGRSYVVFGDVPPVLINNTLSLYPGETVEITAKNLAASDRNHNNDTLVFIPTIITHGQFETTQQPGVALANFTQWQISNCSIRFVHDNSSTAPSYQITVRSLGIAWAGPEPAQIFFGPLRLESNQLTIDQGQTVTLTSGNLQATDMGETESDLSFWISDLTHGQFEFLSEPDQGILKFLQQNITDGVVRFIHDNTINAPTYQVAVSNSALTNPAEAAFIDFDTNPVLVNNQLVINQGQSVLLTAAVLSASHPGATDEGGLRFDISAIQHSQFSWLSAPSNPITSFYQQNITDQQVQFTQDNSVIAPAYTVSVTDGRTRSQTQAAQIDFDATPVLGNNTLRINQGEIVLVTSETLSATHPTGEDSVLLFNITELSHGQFSWVSAPDIPVTSFYQQNITAQKIQFRQDGSSLAPAYDVSVTDGRTISIPQAAQIDFDAIPVLVNNSLRISQGETVSLTPVILSATHSTGDEDSLLFNLTEIHQGRFHALNSSEEALIYFYQRDITNGLIQFTHDNSTQAPAYQVAVTDGRITTIPQLAAVTFLLKPMLIHNQFLASRGQATVLTTDNIAATRNGTLAEDLQFMVTGTVEHGRFEQRGSPGSAITSFYQQDILQQKIQFIHDNSTVTPAYSLRVQDNQNDLSSDTQTGKTLLVVTNYFPVNQGETLVMTESVLNATSAQPQNTGSIIFTPITGTVQHGHFALTTVPNYPLTSFQQQQIHDNVIVFVPDGSAIAPSSYLTISDGQTGGVQGAMACQIDFDALPVLQKAYLKTSVGEQIRMTDINLKAGSSTSPVNGLLFEISAITHGYFADNDQWQEPLSNFTQQKITDGDIIFITDHSGQSPQFQVSVWDGRLRCTGCPQSAEVVFQNDSSPSANLSEVIRNAIIGAAVSGAMGLLFFVLRYKYLLNLQRAARPTLDGEERDTYSDVILLPIAREIFSRIKIGGCLGYISQARYNEYVGAVSVIVAALESRKILQPENWHTLPRPQKQKLIEAIAVQTKERVGNNRCCSTRAFTGFFRAEATPKMIRDQAEEIADAVQETLSDRTEAKGTRNRRSVHLTSASSSLNQSQMRMPLLS